MKGKQMQSSLYDNQPNPDNPLDRGDDEALLEWQQSNAADEAAIEAYYEEMRERQSSAAGRESQKDDKRPARE